MIRPYDAETTREHILAIANQPAPEIIDQGTRGAIIGSINKILASDGDYKKADLKRHTILGWLFGDPQKPLKPMSTKSLADSQWYALFRWLQLMRTVDAKWLPVIEFQPELLFVLNAALRKAERDELEMYKLAGLTEEG